MSDWYFTGHRIAIEGGEYVAHFTSACKATGEVRRYKIIGGRIEVTLIAHKKAKGGK